MAKKRVRSAGIRQLGRLTAAVAAALAPTAGAAVFSATPMDGAVSRQAGETSSLSQTREFSFRHEGILGTSLDLFVRTSRADDARSCARATLKEIERLRGMLSIRDSQSEISLAMSNPQPTICSAEIVQLLQSYDLWSMRTGGAISGNTAKLAQSYAADSTGQTILSTSAWHIDSDRRVTFTNPQLVNLDALGKGFILDRALTAARTAAPSVEAILLNIGGDIATFGGPWHIGIADPANRADNVPPLTRVVLHDAAIATSASYERSHLINGTTFSHLFDPRSGQPASGAVSGTAIAPDALTANALATSLCVLGPVDSAGLFDAQTGGLAIVESGSSYRFGVFGQVETKLADPPAAASAWPADKQLSISLALKQNFGGRRGTRPYVAVWVTDDKGKAVRTITVWGQQPKYLRDLSTWFRVAGQDQNLVRAVTRATRNAGSYTLTWDGTDDKNKPLPPGTYTINVEVNREHGGHTNKSVAIKCGGPTNETAKMEATTETDEIQVDYGPKTKDGK